MTLLVDIQYFPRLDYFLSLFSLEHVKFEIYDHHRKMSFRNRCVIAGANGPINLSIPVVGGRDQKKISREVLVDNSAKWQIQHFKSLVSAYNRSPFFDYYRSDLKVLFDARGSRLFEWNLLCLEWLTSVTGVKLKHSVTEFYESTPAAHEYVDMRDYFLPKVSDNSGVSPLTYRQVFEEKTGHQEGMSTLDFLFCAGPQALRSAISQARSN